MRSILATVAALGVAGLWAADAPKPAARFDFEVREDLFAGFGGDKEALVRGIAKCDAALATNPKHAEALVWRGAGRVFQAGQLFAAQKQLDGFKLWTAGLKDMDEAVALDPDSPAVRIPRASVLVPAGRSAPPAMGKPLLEKALGDFRHIEKKQEKVLGELGTHPRGELRMGLADVLRLLGKADESKAELEKINKELPGTRYAKRAEEWLAAKPEAKLSHQCIGCHTAKK